MTRPRIHWCWPEIVDESKAIRQKLQELGDFTCDQALPPASDSVDILVPRMAHCIDAPTLSRLHGLRAVATPSTGTDHIDVGAAAERGIVVISLRQDPEFLKQLQSTAELAWLLILACSRRAPEAFADALTGRWNPMAVRGRELLGKTLGIVGVGRLGRMVARFGNAFGMRVLGTNVGQISEPGVQSVSLDELLRTADVVSIHVHLDESTRRMIGRRELGMMKPRSILVNTSRGAVLDENALLEVLESGHLGSAGLDVLDGERSDHFVSHPLIEYARKHRNLVLTPHIGGCTEEAQEKAFSHLIDQIGEFCSTIYER